MTNDFTPDPSNKTTLNPSPGTRDYDDAVRRHYDEVAQTHKDSPLSTMEDAIIRKKETDCILGIIQEHTREQETGKGELSIIDVGCGNGYTLSQIRACMPHLLCGIEFNESLRAIANERLDKFNIIAQYGDIRVMDTLPRKKFDILISQRVLINLLNPEDQKKALGNLISIVRNGGLLIFIESFSQGLDNLNEARKEFGLSSIPPAHHNLLLPEDFFSHPSLARWQGGGHRHNPHMLSTHYYVSRVFHEFALNKAGVPFARNSHFVNFFSQSLPDGIGAYSPLQIHVFRKI